MPAKPTPNAREGFISRARAIGSGIITETRLNQAIERGEVRTIRPGTRLVLVHQGDVEALTGTVPASTA